jgi:mono/diheme cytochrome c family protein
MATIAWRARSGWWIVEVLAGGVALLVFQATLVQAQSAAEIYTQRCAACHGPAGKGDGPAAKMLKPGPAPFSTSLPDQTDDWIAKVIKQGGPAVGLSVAMPAQPNLSDDQLKALAQYIQRLH